MSVEDRLRTAARARANLVTDDPPARPARPRADPAAGRAPGPRRWVAWAAPAAAAALVVALAVTLVSIRQAGNESSAPSVRRRASAAIVPRSPRCRSTTPPSRPSPRSTTRRRSNQSSWSWARPAAAAALSTVAPAQRAVVRRRDRRGERPAFIVAAEPYPGPGRCLLGARQLPGTCPHRPRPSARRARLTKLPIPGEPAGTQVDGVALSPDGTELAIMFQPDVWSGNRSRASSTLSIYSVATGQALRTWTQQTKALPGRLRLVLGPGTPTASITWLSDGQTLAFDDGVYSTPGAQPNPALAQLDRDLQRVKLRTINTDRPSGDLLADSKVVFTSARLHACDTMQLTARREDGLSAALRTATSPSSSSAFDPKITEYSVATGKSRPGLPLPGLVQLRLRRCPVDERRWIHDRRRGVRPGRGDGRRPFETRRYVDDGLISKTGSSSR